MGAVPVKTPCDGFVVTVEVSVSVATQPVPTAPVSVIALPLFSVTVTFWLVAVGARQGGLIVSSGKAVLVSVPSVAVTVMG